MNYKYYKMNSKIYNFFDKVTPYAFGYGAIRKMYHVSHPIQKNPYSNTNETKDLYITTKVLLITFGAASNIYLWPTAVIRDIYACEGMLRGHIKSPARDIIELICQ